MTRQPPILAKALKFILGRMEPFLQQLPGPYRVLYGRQRFSTTVTERVRITSSGHLDFLGTAPGTLTAGCGTAATIVGNDHALRITTSGTGQSTTCGATFNQNWANVPVCIAQASTARSPHISPQPRPARLPSPPPRLHHRHRDQRHLQRLPVTAIILKNPAATAGERWSGPNPATRCPARLFRPCFNEIRDTARLQYP